MAKFRLSSLFSGSSSSNGSADVKKQNRRSFSGLSARSPRKPRQEDSQSDGTTLAALPADAAEESPSRMVALAQTITRETEKFEAYFKANGLPLPSFDAQAPADLPRLPKEIQKSRQDIIFATKQLRDLAVGPRESVRWGTWGHLDVLALQILNHFGIPKLVPVDGTITLSELQTKTPLDPVNLARIMRVGITNNIFAEPSPGVIAHTAASRVMAEDEDLQAWVGFNTEDIFPASAHVLQALQRYPEAIHLTQTGFNFAFDTVDKEPMFVTFGKDPARAKRMGRAMASLTGGEGYELSYLVDVENGGYDFGAVDAAEGTFVDIGGSHGFVCVDLAKRYKNMKFVVQDLQKTVDSAPKPISEDAQMAERITLQAHDFFTEQPVKGADVYFFRWIIHNYSNPYAVKILRALIPALKPGARVLINDNCLSEAGSENPWDEARMHRMDLVMLALLNAQERTEAEFRELFRTVDEGFVFKGATRPPGSRMSIVEAVWRPDLVEGAAEEPAAAAAAAAATVTTADEQAVGAPSEDKAEELEPAGEPKSEPETAKV